LNLQLPAGPDGAIPAGRLDEVFDIGDPGERQRDKVGGYWFGLRQRRGSSGPDTDEAQRSSGLPGWQPSSACPCLVHGVLRGRSTTVGCGEKDCPPFIRP
jgi:hypothetical protein